MTGYKDYKRQVTHTEYTFINEAAKNWSKCTFENDGVRLYNKCPEITSDNDKIIYILTDENGIGYLPLDSEKFKIASLTLKKTDFNNK